MRFPQLLAFFKGLWRLWRIYYKASLEFILYLDDILIIGVTESDHLKSLEEVLRRLAKAGFRVKKNKCKFMVPYVS